MVKLFAMYVYIYIYIYTHPYIYKIINLYTLCCTQLLNHV